ncbi:hypothetical protein [Frankia sp. CeD]|uniref:hypothetical protein n=1 Tax=Frankia sp. CeD TaxID=258230 RepID=UPI0004DD47E6|nr:hypothetical protein [Frankia sp. CeD]KEZ35855.1 hypothetical protein CEDDRAFT_02851 [Frankia sp. CeD]
MARRPASAAARAAIAAGLRHYWATRSGGQQDRSVRIGPVRVGVRDRNAPPRTTLGAAAQAHRQHRDAQRTRALNSGLGGDVDRARAQARHQREQDAASRDERLAQAHRRRLSRGQTSTPEHRAAHQRHQARMRQRQAASREAEREAAPHRRPNPGARRRPQPPPRRRQSPRRRTTGTS